MKILLQRQSSYLFVYDAHLDNYINIYMHDAMVIWDILLFGFFGLTLQRKSRITG